MLATERRILLVEDDPNFGDILRSYLEMHDYHVTLASDGMIGWDQFQKHSFDLCILDVMMPKKDGFSLAKDIRSKNETIPLIFLTARSMKEDLLEGFKIGADDYLTKPFNSAELLARIQAILKRTAPKPDPRDEIQDFAFGKFNYHHPLRELSITLSEGNTEVFRLSPKESELLKFLVMRIGEVTPRSECLKRLWGDDNYFNARSMDVFMTKIRKYLLLDPKVELLNIHGSGFLLKVNA